MGSRLHALRDRDRPDAWFFEGYFQNDARTPGNFMVAACVRSIIFHLAALGYSVQRDGWRFQPLPGHEFELKCRGEIKPQTAGVTYELHVREVWGHRTRRSSVTCSVSSTADPPSTPPASARS